MTQPIRSVGEQFNSYGGSALGVFGSWYNFKTANNNDFYDANRALNFYAGALTVFDSTAKGFAGLAGLGDRYAPYGASLGKLGYVPGVGTDVAGLGYGVAWQDRQQVYGGALSLSLGITGAAVAIGFANPEYAPTFYTAGSLAGAYISNTYPIADLLGAESNLRDAAIFPAGDGRFVHATNLVWGGNGSTFYWEPVGAPFRSIGAEGAQKFSPTLFPENSGFMPVIDNGPAPNGYDKPWGSASGPWGQSASSCI